MTNASHLSRRMIRGFAASVVLLGGMLVLSHGLASHFLAAERAALADRMRWEAARGTVARAALDALAPRASDDAVARPGLADAAGALDAIGGAPDRDLAAFAAAARGLAAAPGDRARAQSLVARTGVLLARFDTLLAAADRAAGIAAAAAARVRLAGLLAGLGGLVIVALAILRPMLGEVTRVTRMLEETRERLAHSALHDHLTGLPNRRYVEEHLRRTLATASRSGHLVAVLQVDLDGFKQINDRFGHAVGDVALASVAGLMQSAIRRSDFLGRTGGDEFVVIAQEARNPRGLEALAERLIATVGTPIAVASGHCEIGASVGIALAPPLECESERLLSHADAALYAAKAEGRGLYRFHPDAQTYLDVHYPARLAPVQGGRGASRDDATAGATAGAMAGADIAGPQPAPIRT
ncbi:MAG: GGDEF domain-containing protein [Thermohalobaculum sp.]|nr:GGDEF domain-containing protein [Thermohalobaculum sp.]